jgi:hypothetical protein
MKPCRARIINLVILFAACTLGMMVSFLAITVCIDVLVWLLTGTFDLTKADIFNAIKIGCVMGIITGVVFAVARLRQLKGF